MASEQPRACIQFMSLVSLQDAAELHECPGGREEDKAECKVNGVHDPPPLLTMMMAEAVEGSSKDGVIPEAGDVKKP